MPASVFIHRRRIEPGGAFHERSQGYREEIRCRGSQRGVEFARLDGVRERSSR
jgi:hypothetical protein